MSQSKDPFNSIASMFLTDPDGVTSSTRINGDADTTASQLAVELLLVGHLPVRGGLWITPYVDAIARAAGPTALIRLDGQDVTIQVLRGDPELLTPVMAPTRHPSWDRVIGGIGAHVHTWIVRPSLRAEPIDLLRTHPDRLTILSSADQAAVVAAYQQIKELSEAADDAGLRMPTIGIAVLGADSETAHDMLERLRKTTSQCLSVEVELAACLPRMDAGMRSAGYARCADVSPALGEVMDCIRGSGDAASVAASSSDADTTSTRASHTHSDAPPPVVESPPPAPEPVASVSTPTPTPPTAPTPTTHVKLSPAPPPPQTTAPAATASPAAERELPHVEVEARQPAQRAEADGPVSLAAYVQGLRALPVQCPMHPQIEIAADEHGRLHLLAREDQMRALTAVQGWATAHAKLLSMACPDARLDAHGTITSHVFTPMPASLADMHNTGLRLHVLAPVEVDGRRGWYAAALNNPS
jgi:hypothetical protein